MSTARSDYFRFLWQLISGWRNRHESMVAGWRERDLSSYLQGKTNPLVLDLANGRLHPQSMLLDAAGYRVYGLDLANRSSSSWVDRLYFLARWLYALRVYQAGTPRRYRLVCGEVEHIPFPSNCFDLVTSVAAFEHFLNVPAVVAEVARVLKPGGLIWIVIHLFTAPSGGHNVKLMEIPLQTLPKGVEQWDHLRRRRLPFHVPLNEWRIQQYLDEFSKHFAVLTHGCKLHEGEHFLSAQLKKELSAYTPQELTCMAYSIVAQKSL